MRRSPIISRWFERSLRKPPREKASSLAQGDAPGAGVGEVPSGAPFYEPLVSVSVRHTFYNQPGHVCPDFEFTPTARTQALIHSLGLILKVNKTGFSVLYNKNRKAALLGYLRRQSELADRNCGFLPRLSVMLPVSNPYFVNFTQMPVDSNPSEKAYYFSNRGARGDPDQAVLDPESDLDDRQPLDVVAHQFAVDMPEGVDQVLVESLDVGTRQGVSASEASVVCIPKYVPAGLLKELAPSAITCKDAEAYWKKHPKDKSLSRDKAYIELAPYPEGRYTVEAGSTRLDVVYANLAPLPLCFLDLFFSEPKRGPGKDGIYPVSLDGSGAITPVHYFLDFEARRTTWRYYIVPGSEWERCEDLRIDALWPDVRFSGPEIRPIATGADAYRFVSESPLQLQRYPDKQFRLLGSLENRGGFRTEDRVLLERLPTASAQQVVPTEKQTSHRTGSDVQQGLTRQQQSSDTVYSDIYVYV